MAAALFNNLAKKAIADSAGTKPAAKINPDAAKVMKEIGIDIGKNKPKLLTRGMIGKFDIFVTMGCIKGCPITPKEKTIDWGIENPKGKNIEKFREVRDKIKKKIEDLSKHA